MDEDAPTYLTVSETARRLGVHENTVRNWARSGKLPSARLPGARANRFDARDVERMVSHRGELVTIVSEERRTIGPELVDASQLHQWSETASRDAQDTVPELVRRLLSHTPGITAISMRAGDGVLLSGWDGQANSTGSAFLPAGDLRLEIGTDKRVKQKADQDWADRLPTPDAHKLTFIFVTSRRWREGRAWAEARKAEGVFADVRVLDADELHGWLQTVPHVHYWISEHLGRTPHQAQTLSQWWARFSRQTSPNLPASFFLAGREGPGQRLRDLLGGEPDVITVKAKWRDDALAFVAASLESLATDQGAALPPALVVTGADAWHRLAASPAPTILIPLFDDPDVGTAAESHHVVVPVGADADVRGNIITLDPPHRELARKSLEETGGLSFDQAYKLSALARRSMPSFVRALSRDHRRRQPEWATNQASARILAPLVLAAAWTPSDGDWSVVTELTDTDKDTVERVLLQVSRIDDPPFVHPGGSRWQVVSQEETLMVLKDQLTTSDLDRWRRLTPKVLLEPNPVLDLDPDEQVLAGVRGIGREASGVLRRGLAEGLAALSSLEDEPLAGNVTCSDIAGRVVYTILAEATADASGRIWRSLSDVLRFLAEAAPAVFLDAVLDDLDTATPALATMFQDARRDSWIGSSSPHSGLLWALEVLCWSPEYLGLASLALAKLEAVDPGGTLANRPLASLQSVFVYWVRHTAAPLAEKVRAIDAICEQVPDVGWQLVIALWPSTHATAMPPASPRFRDWQPDGRRVPMTEGIEFIDHLVKLAISLAAADSNRWKELVTGVAPLPSAQREMVLDALEQGAKSESLDETVQLGLWETLRAEVARHRQFKDAVWAMDEATVSRLDGIADLAKPTGGAGRFAYLFDWHIHLPEIDRMDFAAQRERLMQLRDDAARETLAAGGIAGLEALALRAKVPNQLGLAIGAVAPDSLESDLVGWLGSDDQNLREAALAWMRYKMSYSSTGLDWFRRMIESKPMAPEGRRLDLVLSAPPQRDFWDAMTNVDASLADQYWRNCHPMAVRSADIARAINELLQRGRPWVAVALIAAERHSNEPGTTLTPEDARRTLDLAARTPLPEHLPEGIGYEVGVVLDYLEKAGVDQLAIAQHEFTLFRLIQHHRQPRALFGALGADHKSYVDLVSRAFRGKDQREQARDESDAALAQHAYWILLHWEGLPGFDDSGAIDAGHLTEWVSEARLMFAESGRADIGDEQIGMVLSHSPVGADGIWPAEPVRDIIESVGSTNIESGIVHGELNGRGPTSRGSFDGGDQERDLATKYREWSRQTATTARRTSRVLRLIAESYERQGRVHDADAVVTSDIE